MAGTIYRVGGELFHDKCIDDTMKTDANTKTVAEADVDEVEVCGGCNEAIRGDESDELGDLMGIDPDGGDEPEAETKS